MEDAAKVLIPKSDKDHKDCGAYHPITLLNLDVKIYMKILALRLTPILPTLIHEDHSVFVTQRQTFDSIRRLAHLIEKSHK